MPPYKRPQSPDWYSDFRAPDIKNPGSLRRYRLSLGVTGSLREAVAAEKALMRQIEQEAEVQAEKAAAAASAGASADHPHAAFSGYSAFWLDSYVRVHCKPATYGLYESMCRVWLVPWFGDRAIADITALDIQKFVAWAADQPRRMSRAPDEAKRAKREDTPRPTPKYLNSLVACLSSMLNRAIKWRYIRLNPCDDVERLHEEESEMDFYAHDESELWLAKCLELEPRWHAFFLVAFRSGLRLGELRALRQHEDLDLVNRRILVRRSITRGMVRDAATGARTSIDVETDPKGRRSRVVGMAPSLVEVLRDARHLRGPLLFCREDGTALKRRQIVTVWERVTRASGLRLIRLHDMRHTFASGLVARGAPLEGVGKLLGHRSERTTRRYAHLSPSQVASYVDLLDGPLPDTHSGTLPGGSALSAGNDSNKVVRGTRFELAGRRGGGAR